MNRKAGSAACRPNGFTIVEMMLVLLMVSVLALFTASVKPVPLVVFMKTLESSILEQQVKAYAMNEERHLEITGNALRTEDGETGFPSGTVCTPFSWHYTGNGTISQGGTVNCTNGEEDHSLVFRIGAGRVTIR
ncbi:prepilin-type N-terminal cleavage/methylation domain-containing protein [Faecalibaculum rodentium]|uniref:prepilin-type N-terminal cleavage/methylation domain-containing protein n=2 Tax=Faecalibaculum rodentium TaxID=1702221 RepID=UPI00260CEE0B|nr:prepilin-type N-terminal cleavage/methylation domain-containing protein [Faecalibaculum rodentium]